MTHRTRKRLVFVLAALGVFIAVAFIHNSSWLYGAPAQVTNLVADGYASGIETDRVDQLGPALKQRIETIRP